MQPQYAPQFPTQPGYPQQPYPAQPAPQYPPQQYAGQAYTPQYGQPAYGPPAQPPRPPAPVGTLDDYYDQPASGGGPSFKFIDASRQPMIGKWYAGIVSRPITNADVQAQVDPNTGITRTYKDGRPKFVLVVPMQVQPSPEFPDGVAGWWVKGQARDELARAMAEAGAPVGTPEPGAAIRVTLMSTRPVPNMNPAFVYRVEYMRPAGAAPVAQPAPPAQPITQAPGYPPMAMEPQYAPVQPAQAFYPDGNTAPVYGVPTVHTGGVVPGPAPQFVPPAQPVQPMPQPGPAQTAPAPQQVPAGFDADQAALFAKLTGQPAPTAG